LDRKLSSRRFCRQHHRVGTFENGGGDVGYFSARRNGRIDHRFQHLRGDHHRFAGAAARARHLFLHAGHFFQRHFHAEISARDHQCVGEIHDFVEAMDRLGLFDLGHDCGTATCDLLCLGEVFRPLDERQRHPVDAGFERCFKVRPVFIGQS
jgi:hypothetical protein